MKRNTLLILGAAFVVIAFAAGFVVSRVERPTRQDRLWTGDPGAVTSVTETGPMGRVVLTREGGAWKLTAPLQYPAQATLVQSLLTKVSGASLNGPLADSASEYPVFGLETASATKVELGGPAAFTFYAGKSNTDDTSLYVRAGEAPQVYEASGLSSYDVARGSADWMSRGILEIPAGSLRSLAIRSARAVELAQGPGGSWRLGENGPAVSTATGSAFDAARGALADLEADQVLLPPFPRLSGKPVLELKVAWTDNGKPRTSVLSAYKPKDSLMTVVLAGQDAVRYQVYSWKLDPFRKPASAFR